MHYYKRNIGDYAKKAGRLSMLQHGAYTLLIDSCYDREQFPTLDEAIDWTWSSSQAEIDAVKFVLSKFFVLQDGVYVHPSIKEEIDAYHETSEKNKRIAEEREAKRRASSTDRARVVHEESKDGHLTINQEPKGESASADASPSAAEKPKARKAQTLTAYLAECKAIAVKPVPDDHHIRQWADDAGIVPDMLQIAWVKFRERYTEAEKGKAKRYKDWPGHFATAVKDNWFKLWFADADGIKWTTNGLTCKTVLDARMKQQEAEHAA